VSLRYRPVDGSETIAVDDEARQRGFTLAELTGLATAAGSSMEAALGGFDEALPIDSPQAARMILSLRRA